MRSPATGRANEHWIATRCEHRWLALLLILLASILPGCANRRAARRVSGASDRLRHIEVDGNAALSEKEIEPYLNLRETQWFPLPQLRYVYEGMIPVDRDRIETLYERRGYHDAAVLDARVEPHPRKDNVADVRFVVDEGEPTLVTGIEFHWPDGPPQGRADRKAAPEQIQTRCGMTVGAPFDTEEMHASEATMSAALHDRGYAFAEVLASAQVDRVAKQAKVEFTLRPGPWVRIGTITIEGLSAVPEHAVRVEVEGDVGKPYSPTRLDRIEESVYGMQVFSTVSVKADEQPHGDRIDLTVRVVEGKPQSVRLGVGLGLEPNRWEEYGEVQYQHTNLFRTLTALDVRLRAGYAELPALYNPQEHGPIVLLRPKLRKKGLLEDKLVWTLEPGFELGVWEGYQFFAPTNRIGVSRFFTRWFELSVSHNARYVDFFNVSPTLDRSRSTLGLDYRDPYLLSYIEVEPRVRITDRLIDPTNGVEFGIKYNIAGGIFGGMFDYNKITPEIIGRYTPLKRRLQFAARAQVGFILPFGDEPGAPFDLKYYLGGSSTVRGWGLRRLSPTVTYCPPTGACRTLPVGGNTSVLGNFETRVRVWRDLWAVGFFDAGDVQSGRVEIRPDQWNYSAGPGLRYDSKIGTFRVDLGVRLNDDPARFPGERRVAVHFGLGEAF